MMNRLRKLFESIVYAGMQQRVDPFYLSNRTLSQKLRLAGLIALPCVLVTAGVGLAVLGYFDSRPSGGPPPTLRPEQIAAKMLPNLARDLKLPGNPDVEISDLHVEHGSVARIVGIARNMSGHPIQDAEIVFDLTDAAGSRLGAVSAQIPRMEPKGTAPFSCTIEQRQTAFALVREIREP